MDTQQRIRSEQDASEATVAAVVERVRVQREAAEAAEQLRVEQEQLRMEQAQREALEAAKRATEQAEAERLAAGGGGEAGCRAGAARGPNPNPQKCRI